MSMLQSVPAVRRVDSEPPSLQVFDIVGHVSSADIENLFGLLEASYLLHHEVDVLIRMIDFEGIEFDDVSEETLATGKQLAKAHVRRCAVVGDQHGRSEASGFFLKTTGVEWKEFAPEDEPAAWEWLTTEPAVART